MVWNRDEVLLSSSEVKLRFLMRISAINVSVKYICEVMPVKYCQQPSENNKNLGKCTKLYIFWPPRTILFFYYLFNYVLLLILEDVDASSDVNIQLWQYSSSYFTQKNFWVPKRDSNPQSSDRRWDALSIELLGLRWLNVGCNSMLDIFTAKR